MTWRTAISTKAAYAVVTVIATGLLGSCGRSSGSDHCSFDQVCPADLACDPIHELCVQPAQLTVCEAVTDGAACSYPGTLVGVCASEVCLPSVCGDGFRDPTEQCDDHNTSSGDGCSSDCRSDETCGNGFIDLAAGEACDDGATASNDGCSPSCQVEQCGNSTINPGEACDDGNQRSGDGCSADCRSDETCSNGYTDFLAGEQCDDGNLASHDGCSSGCTAESLIWQEKTRPLPPAILASPIYDAARGGVLLIGGFGTDGSARRAWKYDGVNWTAEVELPLEVTLASMAAVYDSARARSIVYTYSLSDDLGSTWELDGNSWTRSPSAEQPTTYYAGMAYDAARDRVVLFGGWTDDGYNNETWEYDGTQWRQMVLPNAPSPRYFTALVYDELRERIVAFSGRSAAGDQNDMWAYNSEGWTQLTTTSAPPRRDAPAAVYDSVNDKIILFSGSTADGRPGDTWEFDCATNSWTETTPPESPSGRFYHSLAYDPVRERTVLYGGRNDGTNSLDDTWEYDSSTATWTRQRPWPEPRFTSPIAYDAARGRTVWFDPQAAETWEHDGDRWWRVLPTGAPPPPRRGHTLAYYPPRQTVVLHGGLGLTDTWEFDGLGWSQLVTATNPPPRIAGALAYDPTTHRLVLFGGLGTDMNVHNDTWEFDGTNWQPIAAAIKPPPRWHHAFAYAPNTNKLVLAGGASDLTTGLHDDSWQRTGATWVRDASIILPRRSAALASFPPMEQVLLIGGETPISLVGNDLLGFDGTNWTPVEVVGDRPPPRSEHGAVYDAARKQLLVFGGRGGTEDSSDDTWVLRYHSEWPDEVCSGDTDVDNDGLAGCNDPDCTDVPSCR